ncbi:uncharacterized protein LOC132868060 [Neoarius graeffei]|uniref:uncharacterized protein LOC132868060 n=1 Tax=Neoarius graeffei TaxID=443677 RepID=UPI00298BF2DF|nr:uncharacterized protein LOC132868060 [Neoarius graeffei]
MFNDWPDLNIRLDAWHFMRRFFAGCTTDSHQLYGLFMGRLSACIFEWSSEDLQRLREAKHAELQTQKIRNPTDSDVSSRITGKELALHCRWKTRSVEETTNMIEELLGVFDSDQGRDTLGVPLLDTERIWNIWLSQKRHVACIQDPQGFSLYTKTHKQKKGGVVLPVFRYECKSASGMHFQAYLLEGLVRWNEDRASAAVQLDTSPSLAERELIGIEYLYSQTGEVLQDYTPDPDSEDSACLDAHLDDKDEGFEEASLDVELQPPLLEDESPIRQPSRNSMRSAEMKRQLFKSPAREPPASATVSNSPAVLPLTSTTVAMSTPRLPDRPTMPLAATGSQTPPPPQDSPEESVDQNNIPGYGRVEDLAQFLFLLKDQTGPLRNSQAEQIIRLWHNLDEYDTSPTSFSPRHKTKARGRFKAAKSSVAPGVESTKRCFLGQNTGPAQWPDCNRYMECLITKLCTENPSPVRHNKGTVQRWTLICRTYQDIRQKVLHNPQVMQQTNIQLVEINQATLLQWSSSSQTFQIFFGARFRQEGADKKVSYSLLLPAIACRLSI